MTRVSIVKRSVGPSEVVRGRLRSLIGRSLHGGIGASVAFAAVVGPCAKGRVPARPKPEANTSTPKAPLPGPDTTAFDPAVQALVLRRVAPFRARTRYEVIYNGGRIWLEAVRADSAQVQAIRAYLYDMTTALRRHDYARYFNGANEVPGVKGIIARADLVYFVFKARPWGAEVYLWTDDPMARVSIREFIQYQRKIHTPG